jgi:hypothetical protein
MQTLSFKTIFCGLRQYLTLRSARRTMLTRISQVYILLSDYGSNKRRTEWHCKLPTKGRSNRSTKFLRWIWNSSCQCTIRSSVTACLRTLTHIFSSVVHVPCTLGRFVTCLVLSFTTFLPREHLSLLACNMMSSGAKFLTQTTLSLWFSAQKYYSNWSTNIHEFMKNNKDDGLI